MINAVPAQCYAVLASKHDEAVCSVCSQIIRTTVALPQSNRERYKSYLQGRIYAHASTPQKAKNAITAMLEMLVTLDIKDETKKLLGDILETLSIRRNRRFFTEDCLRGIEGVGVRCTCVLSLINAENGRLDFNTDIRFPISMTLSQLKSKLENAVDGTGISIAEFTGTNAHYACPLPTAFL